MHYECAFGEGSFDVAITLSGDVSAEGIDEIRRAVAADPRLRPGMTILWNFNGANAEPLSGSAVRALASDTPLFGKRPRAAAFVAPTPLAFGFSRMFGMLARADQLVDHFAVCTSVAEAELWLRTHDEASTAAS